MDGTIVREPGKTGSQWRILYSLKLPSLICDFFDVTATIGEGSGESLKRLPVGPHELILAYAGYCSIAGIEYVRQHGADVLVRVNPQSFVAYSAHGRRISLLPRLRTLSKVGQSGEWWVVLHGQGSSFAGRLCAVRKSDCAIQQAHRRLQRKASKKQMITRRGTLEFAKYVIVFTTRSSGSTADVLRSYRMRWQIELVFKRLKSLAQLGHVPKHDDRSSRAWVYGKLLVALLTQKLIRIGAIFPPGATYSQRTRPTSPWREFSFALHQIQQAIEPHLSLQQTLFSWNQIAQALAENSRNRLLQLANDIPREHRSKVPDRNLLPPVTEADRSATTLFLPDEY
ncbi:MAG: transposase [Candidatus Sulfotelmatobacter sp.]